MKIELDHIGLITGKKRDKEKFAADMKLWLTDPKDNSFNIEWLSFEEDSPIKGLVREKTI